MNIEPITINESKTTTTSFKLSRLNDVHPTADDPIRGILKIQLFEAVPPQMIVVTGQDYSNLGQWTDESLNQYLINKFNLNTGVIPPSGI